MSEEKGSFIITCAFDISHRKPTDVPFIVRFPVFHKVRQYLNFYASARHSPESNRRAFTSSARFLLVALCGIRAWHKVGKEFTYGYLQESASNACPQFSNLTSRPPLIRP